MESTDNIDNTNINIREIENENKLKDMMSIESYINSSKLELHNYINQYKNYYYSSVKNTLVYFELFKEVICHVLLSDKEKFCCFLGEGRILTPAMLLPASLTLEKLFFL